MEGVRNRVKPSNESERLFIEEHGRLRRPESHPAFDPFRRAGSAPLNLLDFVKGILGLVIIPLRLALSVAVMAIPYFMVVLFGPKVNMAIIRSYEVEMLPPWRRRICTVASQFLGRCLLIILGFWVVKGSDDPEFCEEEAVKATVVSNHVSLADPCLVAYLYGASFVSKFAVALIPFVGRVGASQHTFYINRMDASTGGPGVTGKIVERQRLIAAAKVPLPPVAIFPEGTTTSGNYMLRFRTGAFVAGTPVAPIIIRYPFRHFSPSYESIRTVPYLYRLLSQFCNNVAYLRLPVYYPSEAEKADPRLYADNVMNLIRDRSDFLPGTRKFEISESTYTDKIEYHSITRKTKLKKGVKLS